LLVYFLERDDLFEGPQYYRLEAWPGPVLARVRIHFDPQETDELRLKQAITEPYYDAIMDDWRHSPFRVEGYDPLGLESIPEGDLPKDGLLDLERLLPMP
jgi:hypothetical protein